MLLLTLALACGTLSIAIAKTPWHDDQGRSTAGSFVQSDNPGRIGLRAIGPDLGSFDVGLGGPTGPTH